jgi:hypothetical protein
LEIRNRAGKVRKGEKGKGLFLIWVEVGKQNCCEEKQEELIRKNGWHVRDGECGRGKGEERRGRKREGRGKREKGRVKTNRKDGRGRREERRE